MKEDALQAVNIVKSQLYESWQIDYVSKIVNLTIYKLAKVAVKQVIHEVWKEFRRNKFLIISLT